MGIRGSRKEHGFTLMELMIAIAIIGILTGIGMLQFRASQARQELDRAAWELASDIRWMQQLSANDATPRRANPPTYRFTLRLWAGSYVPEDPGIPAGTANSYQVQDRPLGGAVTVMKTLNFNDYRTTATIVGGAGSIGITFYSYDLDMLVNGQLANAAYRVQLTHNNVSTPRFVNVDSRVGRVWVE